ncbi:MAG: 30S ribosomal protein S1 [Crocinitomicaceae bacterium]|nr:30S ribosomal protein S1 [Crocinitomicaceae bacterium]
MADEKKIAKNEEAKSEKVQEVAAEAPSQVAEKEISEETPNEKEAPELVAEEAAAEPVAEEEAPEVVAEEAAAEPVAEEEVPEVVAEEAATEPVAEEEAPAVVVEEAAAEPVAEEEAPEVVAEAVAVEPVAEEEATAVVAEAVAAEPVAEEESAILAEAPADENVAPEDFDWDAFDAGIEGYSKEDIVKYDEMYDGTLTSITEKEVVSGSVVAITKKEIVVNIGYKSEGVVPINEFRYNPELKIGDPVDLFIEKQEDKTGQLVVSHKRARTHKAWDRVNEVLKTGEVITGFVKCRTKGGLIADVFGIEAFLPGSQIDVKPIRDYDLYVGKNMEFKVVKINHEFRNVVVSHKALIEAELEQQKKLIIGTLEKGQVLEGTVKNITSYGVFIDLGGVDGLVHITDLSWGRVNHPEEIVELDQKLNVVILDFDNDKKRIALGLKQLQEHPWEALQTELKVGDAIKGKVVVIADYGAFIEIAPGVEGLVHVSEMSWSQHLRSAQDFLKVGDEVETQVLTLDREERKMSLGIKQLMPDPWAEIESKYPIESKHKARVKNFTNFGVFVELEEGIDGLIHISDLSWAKKIKHPSEFCNVDDELDVLVLELDKEGRRLSLGHKQLEENPWDVFESVFVDGSVHQGTVIKLQDKTGIISLPYGVEGYAPAKHMKKEDGSKVEAEDVLDFKVLEFNKDSKKIIVSHTLTYSNEVESGVSKKKKDGGGASKAVKDLNSKQEKTTLGDLDALSALKEKMEKGK